VRIISKFHDYYDSAMAHGQDRTICYLRRTGPIAAPFRGHELPWLVKSAYGRAIGERNVTMIEKARGSKKVLSQNAFKRCYVLIAGRAYPVWVREGTEDALAGRSTLVEVIPTNDTVCGGPELSNLVKQFERLTPPKYITECRTPETTMHGNTDDVYHVAEQVFLQGRYPAFHLLVGAPVVLVGPLAFRDTPHFDKSTKTWVVPDDVEVIPGAPEDHRTWAIRNPCLASLGMQSVLPPNECFQEIASFLDGVVPGRTLPMVQINDESKILKQGFDPLYSFRHRPQKDK
jgi:hypothetical protein